jgi:hypothetical protein
MANFDYYVTDPSLEYPVKLNVSLSAYDNSVVILTGLSAVKYTNSTTKSVAGILFNGVAGTSTATTTLTVITGANGFAMKVDPKYNNQTFALYFTDNSTLKFTVLTANAVQSLTAGITFDDRGPEERRHFAVEI